MSWKLNLIYDPIRRQFSTFLDLVNFTSLSFTTLRTVFAIFPPLQSPVSTLSSSHLNISSYTKARLPTRWEVEAMLLDGPT